MRERCALGRCREQTRDRHELILRDGLIVVLAIALVWVLVSWASGGAAIAEEHAARTAAEQQVSAQATRIASLTHALPPALSRP